MAKDEKFRYTPLRRTLALPLHGYARCNVVRTAPRPRFSAIRFFRFTDLFLTMPNKTESILLVGVIAGLVGLLASFIPAAGGFVACLSYIGAGMLVVWHYADKHGVTLTGGQGVGLGVLTCIAASATSILLEILLSALGIRPTSWEEARQEMHRGMQEGGTDMSQLGAFGDIMTSPVFLIGIGLAFSVLSGVIGGVIGSKLFKRGEEEEKDQPESGDLI